MDTLSANLSDGPRALGPLADRGAFDQYASYRPGNVVVDDGVVYLNILAVGATPELEDTFARRDQDGWGQSSRGEVWQTSEGWSSQLPARISSGRGILDHTSGQRSDGQLLGPSRLRSDAELLCRCTLELPASADTAGLFVGLNATEDGNTYAAVSVSVHDDGTTHLQVQTVASPESEEDGTEQAGPTLTGSQDLWVRLRRVGLDYSATLWFAGTPEPGTPQATLTATHAQPAGHPLLNPAPGTAPNAAVISYFALRPLTAADAPADDTDHWVALADALQVAPPL